MRILHLVSCRGWSSDAYWAARATSELEDRGHEVWLGCRAGTEARVIDRARAEGVRRVETFRFVGGLRPADDVVDVRRLAARLADVDVVHVHRSKEHWLAAVANRLAPRARPVVRTRHIAQAVRPHALNRWLYRAATAWVVTVTDAIRRQYLAAGLVPAERVSALPGGVDSRRYRPVPRDPAVWAQLGGRPGQSLIGMVGGLRAMKGHGLVVEAVALLARSGRRPHVVFVGRGPVESAVRQAIERAGLGGQFTVTGFVPELPAVLAALDVGLYVPMESDGMSRMAFEYLAAGRPLVAARVGVVPEILTDGVDARLVPAGDAPVLAQALADLLDHPEQQARLGTTGRALVEARYSGARLAEALEAGYQRLLAAA